MKFWQKVVTLNLAHSRVIEGLMKREMSKWLTIM